ncbi:hypothetical protein BD309DRAFT_983584 [Dichomitus squalens]|nr:hypothetical protein BD309DRAFT_983584 [Dichomitus squalens]
MSPSTPAKHDNATVATALRIAWVELLWIAWCITCALKAIPDNADDATYSRFNTGVARELWEAINVMDRITAVDTTFRSSTAPGTPSSRLNVKPVHLLLHDIKWSGLSILLDLRQVNRAKVIASLVVPEDVVEFFHNLNSSAVSGEWWSVPVDANSVRAYPWFDTASAAVCRDPQSHFTQSMRSQSSTGCTTWSITSAENMFKNRALQIVRAIKMLDDDIPEDEPDTLA